MCSLLLLITEENKSNLHMQPILIVLRPLTGLKEICYGVIKLVAMGINGSGKMLHALKSLYTNVKCNVRINSCVTDWFEVQTGLKQGCKLSPILFALYINDLCKALDDVGCGSKLDGLKVSSLLYADDIVLLSDTSNGLQTMLNIVYSWCNTWRY